MKKRERYITTWCRQHQQHLIAVTFFILVHLAMGMGRRNSGDPLFNRLRNNGRGGGEDRLKENEPRRSNLYNNYYDNINSNNRQFRTDVSSVSYNVQSSKNSVMKLGSTKTNNLISTLNSNPNSGSSTSSNRKSYLPRQASVNSILRLNPSKSLWDESSHICHTVPGLTKDQMELCLKTPDVTSVALQGIQMATDECAFQMQKHRWNCSSLQGTINPHNTQLLQKGYRESAFGHSIAAAGVAYAVAKACSQGKLLNCGCGFQYDDQVNYFPSKTSDYAFDESNESALKKHGATSWKWSGCSHNMNYGIKFAKIFLDAREKSSDLPSRTNLHNNRVGRLAVAENMEVRCKCHGLSGSCELRTCWRSSPDFRKVGTELKNKFRRAIMIDQSNFGNRPLNRLEYNSEMNLKKLSKQQQQQRRKRDRDRGLQLKKFNKRNSDDNNGVLNAIDLWYYEKSPTYCESNQDFNIPGTSGRRCNRTLSFGGGKDAGSCNTLCCGRGYNTIRQVYTTRCNCQFLWCCQVTCQNCTIDEWITVCK